MSLDPYVLAAPFPNRMVVVKEVARKEDVKSAPSFGKKVWVKVPSEEKKVVQEDEIK